MWTFDAARVFIIRHIETKFADQDPLDYIDVAMRCRVAAWLHPAFQRLCERTTALTAAEGGRLGLQRFAAVCGIREIKGPGRGCGECANCKSRSGYQCALAAKSYADLVKENEILRAPF